MQFKKYQEFKQSLSLNESKQKELSKIETWVRKSGMDYDDWDWNGRELTIFTKDGTEKYSKKDLKDEGVFEGELTESVIGITTDRSFKPADLQKALDKANVKYKMNRLSMTLSVLNLDKKYYDDAKQVVDDLGLTVMMAKESVNEGRMKKVTKSMWNKMDDDARVNALLTAMSDPGRAEDSYELSWEDLPDEATQNMYTESMVIKKETWKELNERLAEKKSLALSESDLNDPFLVQVRVMRHAAKERKALDAYLKANPEPKKRRISFDKYLSLLDIESGIKDDMKDVVKELKQSNTDMEIEAGQKGGDWTDTDANRYGSIMMELEDRYQKLKKKLTPIQSKIEDYKLS